MVGNVLYNMQGQLSNSSDSLCTFFSQLLGQSYQRRILIIARWLMTPPWSGKSTVEILANYIKALLVEPLCITMQHSGISLFANGMLTIEYNWLTRAERESYVQLFMQASQLFSCVETFVGDRFLLSKPKASSEQILSTRLRQTLVRDSIVYLERFSKPLLLVVLQRLLFDESTAITSHPLLHRAEYALQRNLRMSELCHSLSI